MRMDVRTKKGNVGLEGLASSFLYGVAKKRGNLAEASSSFAYLS